MLASSTHDTKRSEDVRARISVLSEMPNDVAGCRSTVGPPQPQASKVKVDGALAPHRSDEYVLYQTLIGTWPLDGFATTDRASLHRSASRST